MAESTINLVGLVKFFWGYLSPRQKLGAAGLLALNLTSSLVQLCFAALMAAFMGAVLSPSLPPAHPGLEWLYGLARVETRITFLAALASAVVLLSLVSSFLTASLTAGNVYLTWQLNHDISVKLLDTYLQQDYLFFKRRNSAELAKNTLVEVQNVCGGLILPLLEACSRLVLVTAFCGILFALSPTVAFGIVGLLVIYYGMVYLFANKRLLKLGQIRLKAQSERFFIAMELFGSIREAKLHHHEYAFLDRYREPTERYCKVNATEASLAQVPKLFLETIAVAALTGTVIEFARHGVAIASAVSVLALYSVAAYRLMPSLQLLFANISQIRSNLAVAEQLKRELDLTEEMTINKMSDFPAVPYPFCAELELRGVSFQYADADRGALDNVTLRVMKGAFTAVCGQTGSGKSTLLDIIVGLIAPTTGELLIDGRPLDGRALRSWQLNFGYVPQEVVLLDDSLRANIAFGVPYAEIDEERVVKAAQLAELRPFIENDLPLRYDTLVGERGSRLSGGQRQRVGIARALYRDTEILLFDEATSALDAVTEARILRNIREDRPSRTMITITHRLSSIRYADQIYLLDAGQLRASGSYLFLESSNDLFAALSARDGLVSNLPDDVNKVARLNF